MTEVQNQKPFSKRKVILIGLAMPFIFLVIALACIYTFVLIARDSSPPDAILQVCVALFLATITPIYYFDYSSYLYFKGVIPFLITIAVQVTAASAIGFILNRSSRIFTTFRFMIKVAAIYFLVGIPFGFMLLSLLTYDPEYRHKEVLPVTTYVEPTGLAEEKNIFSADDTSAPPITLTTNSNPITPFVIPGKIDTNEYTNAIGMQEVQNIEKIVLERVNRIMYPEDRQKGVKAVARLHFSSDRKLVEYNLHIYKDRRSGSGYTIKCRKDGNDWIIIYDGAGSQNSFMWDY